MTIEAGIADSRIVAWKCSIKILVVRNEIM